MGDVFHICIYSFYYCFWVLKTRKKFSEMWDSLRPDIIISRYTPRGTFKEKFYIYFFGVCQ